MTLTAYQYNLPFRYPFVTSKRTFTHRQGVILCLSDAGHHLYSEVAPLAGFSTETLCDIKTQANKYFNDWNTILSENQPIQKLQKHYREENIPASLRFGLDSLAVQIESQRSAQSLQSYLFDNSLANIVVNGLVRLTKKENPLPKTKKLTARGFKTIKCKVGMNFVQELNLLTKIRNRFPDLNIRLDANRVWEPEEAAACLSQLEPLEIEYCEEPLSKPNPERYKRLNSQTSIPLALDESLNRSKQWKKLLPYCSVVIIKPMVIGSFSEIQAICDEVQQRNVEMVFTSSLESCIGRSITAILAAGWSSGNYAHGLNTGEMLKKDILPDHPTIINGSIILSQLSLSDIDRNQLQNITTKILLRS